MVSFNTIDQMAQKSQNNFFVIQACLTVGRVGHVRHPKTYITLTPTAVKINWTNMATKTTSHSTLVGTRLDGTQPIYEQLMWEIKLYSHVAVMPRAWGITATCTGHNRHQL